MITASTETRELDLPADLGRICLTLWGVVGSGRDTKTTTAPVSQAEHIREFGEPFGSNGA